MLQRRECNIPGLVDLGVENLLVGSCKDQQRVTLASTHLGLEASSLDVANQLGELGLGRFIVWGRRQYVDGGVYGG